MVSFERLFLVRTENLKPEEYWDWRKAQHVTAPPPTHPPSAILNWWIRPGQLWPALVLRTAILYRKLLWKQNKQKQNTNNNKQKQTNQANEQTTKRKHKHNTTTKAALLSNANIVIKRIDWAASCIQYYSHFCLLFIPTRYHWNVVLFVKMSYVVNGQVSEFPLLK